ncbi:MAG: hypothetical protein ACRDJ1_12230 [Actinomycetota bacterium]
MRRFTPRRGGGGRLEGADGEVQMLFIAIVLYAAAIVAVAHALARE